MSLRHAAALALVGWYLMLPPTIDPLDMPVNSDAPISKWSHYGSFDSATECESNIQYLHQKAMKFTRAQRVHPTTPEQSEAEQYMFAECIATDDPRLKEK
jgi:hypothetical protein